MSPRKPGTHCRKGHEYAVVGFWLRTSGARDCKVCALARQRRQRARLREIEPRLICSGCDQRFRLPGEYVCGVCSASLPGGPAFNHVRPPEMQGRAVPIFAPWNQHA